MFAGGLGAGGSGLFGTQVPSTGLGLGAGGGLGTGLGTGGGLGAGLVAGSGGGLFGTTSTGTGKTSCSVWDGRRI